MNNIATIKDYMRKPEPTEYPMLLSDIQKKQNIQFWELHKGTTQVTNRKEILFPFILKELQDQNVSYKGYTHPELVEKIYNDLEQFSILTKPLADPNVEGIHVNAWNDVRIQTRDGRSCKIEHFSSPQHAQDIVRRLLNASNIIIDSAVPIADGSLNDNTRISTFFPPIINASVGVSSYIRKLQNQTMTTKQYIDSGFATEKMLDLLAACLRYGASIILAGKVNTGKTTVQQYILSRMPEDWEVITIEGGAREINLVKQDTDGNITNNIIHALARPHENEKYNIDQEKLVVGCLRMNPDGMAVAEMRDVEAHAAQEAALTGNSIITTLHAGNVQQAHGRVASLCRKRYSVDYQNAIFNACNAFPVVVLIRRGEDHVRRIMEISEVIVNGINIEYRTLWKFKTISTVKTADGTVIKGEHIQVNDISENLIEKIYGISDDELEELRKKEDVG